MTPRSFVIGLGLTWAIAGLIEPQLSNAGETMNAVGFVQTFVTAVLVFCWVKAHARANSIDPPTGASLLAALLPPVGVPYYAFRGFGLRAGARLTGLALLTLFGMFAAYATLYELSTMSVT
jgi:hypothetical protein